MMDHPFSAHCEELFGQMSAYIDGDLKAELCAALEIHLQECQNCQIVFNTTLKTIELYRQTAAPISLPDSVRERLFYKLHLEGYLKSGLA